MPTVLYINAIMYDKKEDLIFESLIPIHDISINFHGDGESFKKFKYSGEIENSYDSAVILGAL